MTYLKNDYVPLQFRAKLTTSFIIFSIVCHAALIFINFRVVALSRKAAIVFSYSEKKALRADLRNIEAFLAIAFLLFLLSLILVTIFCFMWLHRAYANLPSFGAKPKYTPGWAVGYYFIPFVNIVMPFFIFTELWEKSKIKKSQFNREQSLQPSLLIGIWWWGLAVGGNVISVAGTLKYRNARLLGDILNGVYIEIVTYFISLVYIAAFVYIIKRISKTQESTHLSVRLRERREKQAQTA